MNDRVRLYGTDQPPQVSTALQAGDLSVELVEGNLRSIRFRGREVLRAVQYVVRDRDWGTCELVLKSLDGRSWKSGFSVDWTAECLAPDAGRLALEASIRCAEGLDLTFEVSAVADGAFETNRCGFCVLHPIDGVAGHPVDVTHSDGRVESTTFPALIEPWQPFKEIAALSHQVMPGVRATCRMEGDVFEMEDQRAWSDASFKTYVRPLARPWPYILSSGEEVTQRIVLQIEARDVVRRSVKMDDPPVELRLGLDEGDRHPAFAVLVSPDDADTVLANTERLVELAPQSLLFHFDPGAGHGRNDLAKFAAIRRCLPALETVLECIVPGRGDPMGELAEIASLVTASGLDPDAVTVGPSVDRQSTPPGSVWPECPPLEDIYGAARQVFPDMRLGGGMFSYFTELNRKRPPVASLDYVTHATCPIVHAADDLSVMQTLEAIPAITRSARAIIADAASYRLGPTTIGMRQNPYGSRTMANPENRRVAMASDDPRQRGLFTAAWLMGYAARLQGAGVDVWTGASMAGPRGLLRDDGRVVPAYWIAKALAGLAGRPRPFLYSSDRSRVDGLALSLAEGSSVWTANLTGKPQRLALPEAGGQWRCTMLDSDCMSIGFPAPRAVDGPVELKPYAVARFDDFASTPSSA